MFEREGPSDSYSEHKVVSNKASFIFNPLKNDLGAGLAEGKDWAARSPQVADHIGSITKLQKDSPMSHRGSEANTLLLNASSTGYMLPNITRNESDMNSLKEATMKVQKSKEQQPNNLPKILLLSQNRHKFNGLVIPSENDGD